QLQGTSGVMHSAELDVADCQYCGDFPRHDYRHDEHLQHFGVCVWTRAENSPSDACVCRHDSGFDCPMVVRKSRSLRHAESNRRQTRCSQSSVEYILPTGEGGPKGRMRGTSSGTPHPALRATLSRWERDFHCLPPAIAFRIAFAASSKRVSVGNFIGLK